MITFTDKELIKEIKERISSLDVRDDIERRAYEIALASLEAEPVAKIIAHYPLGIDVGKQKFVQAIGELPDFGGYLFAAPPAPIVPEEKPMPNPLSMYAVDAVAAIAEVRGWNACRAAILQGDEPVTTTYKSPDDFICMLTGRAKYLREKGEIKSPELLERAAAALQEESVNTQPIPNGWKLVPIDPTKDMLRAGQSVVGFWLNTVHCYSKMLAAAPAAPQQEADNG